MKYLEAIGSYSLAVVLGMIVTIALPGDGSHPTLLEVLLTLLSFGLLCFGVYKTIVVLVNEMNNG